MFPFSAGNEKAKLTQQANDRAGNCGHDQQQHHHGHWAVLVFVVKRRSKKPIAADSFSKTPRFFELRCRPSWDAFSISNIAAHGRYHRLAGHSPYEETPTPQPSFTDAFLFRP